MCPQQCVLVYQGLKMNQILCCDRLPEWENGAIFFPRDYPMSLATKYTQQLRKAYIYFEL